MINIEELDDKFGIEGELGFMEQDGGLVFISVYNKHAEAEICLYGAYVTRFTPHGTFDVLWVSQASDFEEGKPIRGGIPVCFPWFGPHESDEKMPLHGFARILYWEVIETASLPGGETRVVLQLAASSLTKAYWPFEFLARLEVVVGRQLEVRLQVENLGKEVFAYTSALHSYYHVSMIENISIEGLQNTPYYNYQDQVMHVQYDNLLTINGEVNRRYIETTAGCLLHDPVYMRTIKAEKMGSEATVIWNPWKEFCEKAPDLDDEDYQSFVCIEAANIYNNKIKLYPGEKHITGVMIEVDQHKKRLGSEDGGFSIV